MRTIVRTDAGILELNYMWLPTWIGLNTDLKRKLETALAPQFVGMDMSEESLDTMNDILIDYLVEHAPFVDGLREYLEGLKFVTFKDPSAAQQG